MLAAIQQHICTSPSHYTYKSIMLHHPLHMQAESELSPQPAPFLDFSHRYAAWRLGRGVNITLSGLNLFGMCSRALKGTLVDNTGGAAAPGPRQAAVPTAWPDQLLQAAGLPPQGRTLALASPLWSMLSEPDTGNETTLVIGPLKNMTWYTAESAEEGTSAADLPPGKAHVQQAVMVVPAAELLLHHFLSAWADTMPALLVPADASASQTPGDEGPISTEDQPQHASVYADVYASLRPLVDLMLGGQLEGGTASARSAPALRAYSLAPSVVYLAEWVPSPSGNTLQVGAQVLAQSVESGHVHEGA